MRGTGIILLQILFEFGQLLSCFRIRKIKSVFYLKTYVSYSYAKIYRFITHLSKLLYEDHADELR